MQKSSPDGLPVVSVTRPGRWGNPFRVVQEGDQYHVVDTRDGYRMPKSYATHPEAIDKAIRVYRAYLPIAILTGALNTEELRGKHLACFCPLGSPCHADELLRMANLPKPSATDVK